MTTAPELRDGVHAMVEREKMARAARHLRDVYAITPGIPFVKREFGFYRSLDRWKKRGMPQNIPLDELFDYDPPGNHSIGGLGWCEAAFQPAYEIKVIQERGDHELEQDSAGRHVLYFKGRRQGFMPEYVDHPVKNMETWVENVKWRLDHNAPERYDDLEGRMTKAQEAATRGLMITQMLIGGYMYLRSLIGPENTLYAFYDMPDVVHDCMRAWFELADAVIARHQQYVTIDELFMAEDICYNHGCLISPRMMHEFLFPYYQQLIANLKARQLDRTRHLHVQIDTDGRAVPVIPLYIEAIGMDAMSPFEVAAGCDVVELGRQYPGLVMFGGIDKRVLARGHAAIDALLERVLPPMRARGGYIPTSDHGVPEEVSYENYLHYRRRCVELGG